MIWTPRQRQVTALDWLLTRERSALWLSPGAGKTGITLKALDRWFTDGASRGALVIAPKRVCAITWKDQIALWDHSSWMKWADLRTAEGLAAWDAGAADVYLINPEMLPDVAGRSGVVSKILKGRKTVPADTLVIDEISLARDPSGKRFKSLRPHLHHFTRRIGLTGTPAPNSYLDLFGQILLLDDGERLGRAITRYRENYFTSDYMGWKWTIREGAKEKIEAKLADLCLTISGFDEGEVPPCEVRDIEVVIPAEARKRYTKLERDLLVTLERGEIVALSAAALCMKLLQFSSGMSYDGERVTHPIHDAKIAALCKLRADLGGEPLLVFTAFQHEMERVLAAVSGSRRFHEKDMAEWRAGRIRTWVADPRSMSHGIDGMQGSCRNAVWVTPTYSQETYTQANARITRPGQAHPSTVWRLLAKDTIDDAVVESLKMKEDGQSGLMNAVKALQMLRQ